jgi:hypothetical protein
VGNVVIHVDRGTDITELLVLKVYRASVSFVEVAAVTVKPMGIIRTFHISRPICAKFAIRHLHTIPLISCGLH